MKIQNIAFAAMLLTMESQATECPSSLPETSQRTFLKQADHTDFIVKMGLFAGKRSALEQFRPEHMNNPYVKEAYKKELSRLKAASKPGYFNPTIQLIESIISESDKGRVMEPVMGIRVTRSGRINLQTLNPFDVYFNPSLARDVQQRIVEKYQTDGETLSLTQIEYLNFLMEVVDESLNFPDERTDKTGSYETWSLEDYVKNLIPSATAGHFRPSYSDDDDELVWVKTITGKTVQRSKGELKKVPARIR